MQRTPWDMPGRMKNMLESRLLGEISNNFRHEDDTTLMAEREEELKSLLKVKEESEKVGLKLNIHIKTTMRYHFTPVRMAAIQKSTSNKCWRGCGENVVFVV